MTVIVRSTTSTRSQSRDNVDGTRWHLTPDDRTGVLTPRSLIRTTIKRMALLSGLLAAVWTLHDGHLIGQAWSWLNATVLSGPATHPLEIANNNAAITSDQVAPLPSVGPPTPAAAPIPTETSAPAPAPPAEPESRPISSSAPVPQSPAEPAAPISVPEATDPLQKRALAAGLHPNLSRVLLQQMSDADYRNAALAVTKAIAEAADDTEFIWPRQRKPELAQFKIHFVVGAAPGCRRYVVSVVKGGWLTTALPMERCNSSSKQAKRA